MKNKIVSICFAVGFAASSLAAQGWAPSTNVTPVLVSYSTNVFWYSGGSTNWTGADCTAIGIQLGNMTNAAGQKLFPATYFTNINTTLFIQVNDAGMVAPTNIAMQFFQTH